VTETVTPLWAVAVHESGHVVAARALGLTVIRVSVEPVFDRKYQRWRLGATQIRVLDDRVRDFRAEAVGLLAGPAAERYALCRDAGAPGNHREGDIDVEQARWLLSRDTSPHDLPRALRRAQTIAERLIRLRWPAIERLAERLTHSRTLTWRVRDA